jgi:hypothetical protein
MATHREQRRLVHLSGQYRLDEAWDAVTICNLSSRGLMAKCSAPPPKGVTVELRHNEFTIAGEVAWSLGERFGLRCPPPIDLRALHDHAREGRVGRRALPRIPVRIAAEFVLHDAAYTALLTDLSQSGARVHMPQPPSPGLGGVLCWDHHERSCTVLWTAGDTCGVAFDERLPSEDVVRARTSTRLQKGQFGEPVWSRPCIPARLRSAVRAERRQSGRSRLRLDCEARQGDGQWLAVCVENLSREGCCLSWFAGCHVSRPLTLRLPDGTILEAEISRRDDRMIACRFAGGLAQEVLDKVTVR